MVESGSYFQARQIYQELLDIWNGGYLEQATPVPGDRQQLVFKLYDSTWRAYAGRGGQAEAVLQEARDRLETLLRELENASMDRPPELYAQVAASLGEFQLRALTYVDWWSGWSYFEQALDWWAGSTDLDRAREAYLELVYRYTALAEQPNQGYQNAISPMPIQVLDNFLRIAQRDEDRAYGNFLFAQSLSRQRQDARQRLRISQAYENAVEYALKVESLWLDDILYYYANWSSREGNLYFDDQGNLVAEPDYAQAIYYFQQLTKRFKPRESQFVDDARRALDNIREASLGVSVTHAYLPESEVSFMLRSRNLDAVTVEIYPIDLNADLPLKNLNEQKEAWLDSIEIRQLEPWKRYSFTPEPKQEYGPWNNEVRVDLIPEPGAYLVLAKSGTHTARDILLVSSKTLVLKKAGREALIFVADALSGEPVAGAEVVFRQALWQRNDQNPRWEGQRGVTDSSGLIQFEMGETVGPELSLVSGKSGMQQALAYHRGYARPGIEDEPIAYAYADRSLYRPGDTVHWKVVFRHPDKAGHRIPAGETFQYEISGPQGGWSEVGEIVTNDFGTAWVSTALPDSEKLSLGLYRVSFACGGEVLDRITPLFRMEEVELPEFQIQIQTQGTGNEPNTLFQLGDPVQVDIQVDYLSGGPVVGADAEVLIYEDPYFRVEPLARNSRARTTRPQRQGPGRVISRTVYQTDGEGGIEFILPEPTLMNQDLEYTVEARVRDGSGAEVVSRQSIKMTRQPYYVTLEPEYRLYRPGDDASLQVTARDANENPVEVSGRLELERLVWEEIWIDPRGRQISGDEYHSLRNKRGFFSFGNSTRDYRLLRRGYQVEPVDSTELQTGKDGKTTFSRRIREEGYYRVRWISSDQTQVPIRSETHFFAADSASNDIGYHHGGLSIILDPERFEPGISSPVMITSPVSNRWVLITVGDRHLDSARVLKMDGTVKLLDLTFEESQVPGTFLEATMVGELQLFQVREQVKIPPVANTLNLSVEADRSSYLPGESATWEITVTDAKGEPVTGEVSLAVVDEAGFQVQSDYAEDPLDFFYGEMPPFSIQTLSTFNWKRYVDKKPVDGVAPPDDSNEVSRMEESETDEIEALAAFSVTEDFGYQESAPPPMAFMRAAEDRPMASKSGLGGGQGPDIKLRKNFDAALFWDPALKPDEQGKIRVEVPFSDSLTTWRATARGVTRENQFGEGKSETRTRLPLIARLPLPDVLIEGDQWEVAGTVQNNEPKAREVTVTLNVEGSSLSEGSNPATQIRTIEGRGQGVFVWKLQSGDPGTARFELVASTGEYGDRIQRSIPIQEHGMDVIRTISDYATGNTGALGFELPEERRKASTRAEVVVSTTLAPLLLEGFEDLLKIESSTSEGYASRLLTAIALQRVFREKGFPLEVFYQAALRRDLEPPEGSYQEAWQSWLYSQILSLTDMQLGDGSWPWTPNGNSDLYMTAYAVWAINQVQATGFRMEGDPVRRGQEFLLDALVEEEFSPNEQVWILHALASRFAQITSGRPTREETEAFSNLWKNRDFLDSFGMALLARTAAFYGFGQETEILANNLSNGIIRSTGGDGKPLVHWAPGNRSLQFAQSRPETSALVLNALSQLKPASEWLDPAHRWVLRSRQAAGWRNSRETTFGLLGLVAFFIQEPEGQHSAELEVTWNGEALSPLGEKDSGNSFSRLEFSVDPEMLRNGENTFSIRASADDPRFYYRATLHYFTLEEPISAAGERLQVARSFDHLKPRQTLLKGVVEDQVSVRGEDYYIGIGERVESILQITVDQPYPYLVVEDRLPAGFESARQLSGEGFFALRLEESDASSTESAGTRISPQDRIPVYLEIREGKAVFLIDALELGTWEIRYALRAETAGRFHVLPARINTRYLPDLQGDSAEVHLRIIRRTTP